MKTGYAFRYSEWGPVQYEKRGPKQTRLIGRSVSWAGFATVLPNEKIFDSVGECLAALRASVQRSLDYALADVTKLQLKLGEVDAAIEAELREPTR